MLNDNLTLDSVGPDSNLNKDAEPIWKTRKLSKNSIVYDKIQNKSRISQHKSNFSNASNGQAKKRNSYVKLWSKKTTKEMLEQSYKENGLSTSPSRSHLKNTEGLNIKTAPASYYLPRLKSNNTTNSKAY